MSEKWSFFSIFSRFGAFPYVFGQVKEHMQLRVQLILYCFMEEVGREECSKL